MVVSKRPSEQHELVASIVIIHVLGRQRYIFPSYFLGLILSVAVNILWAFKYRYDPGCVSMTCVAAGEGRNPDVVIADLSTCCSTKPSLAALAVEPVAPESLPYCAPEVWPLSLTT